LLLCPETPFCHKNPFMLSQKLKKIIKIHRKPKVENAFVTKSVEIKRLMDFLNEKSSINI